MRSQSSIIVTIIVMAVILAVGSFLAISFVQRRPELPEGSQQTIVEDVPVVISLDPSKQVRLISAAPIVQAQPVEQPTAAAVPDQAAQNPLPTEPPQPTLPPPTLPPAPNPVIFIDYVVQPNEYLYDIARRLDTSITLMAQEGISQNDLVAGTTIRLPIGNPDYCPGRRPYAVAEGDTVYNMSRRLGISIEEIRAINNLDVEYSIQAAQILCVP
jgi:LysM repeat protein